MADFLTVSPDVAFLISELDTSDGLIKFTTQCTAAKWEPAVARQRSGRVEPMGISRTRALHPRVKAGANHNRWNSGYCFFCLGTVLTEQPGG
jgi:hypothetical protein